MAWHHRTSMKKEEDHHTYYQEQQQHTTFTYILQYEIFKEKNIFRGIYIYIYICPFICETISKQEAEKNNKDDWNDRHDVRTYIQYCSPNLLLRIIIAV